MMLDNYKTSEIHYRVDRRKIAFIKFILEAYEGIAVLSTMDRGKGLVRVRIAPGCESVVRHLIADLSEKILIEPMDSACERTPNC